VDYIRLISETGYRNRFAPCFLALKSSQMSKRNRERDPEW
jgi:hypothetical protein